MVRFVTLKYNSNGNHKWPETRWWFLLVVAFAAIWFATPALADVPMFLVAALLKFASIPALVLVLLIEAAAIKWAFALDWRGALLMSVVANAVSTLVGLLAYPVVGAAIYPALAPIVMGIMGGSVSLEILLTLLGVSLLDVVIELPVIAKLRKVKVTVRAATIVLLANVIGSIVLAVAIVDWSDLRRERIPDDEISRLEAYYAEEIAFMEEIFARVPDVFDQDGILIDKEWAETLEAPAEAMRFGMLGLTSRYIHYIVFPRSLHSQSALRGQGVFRRGNLTVWRTVDQDGVWYYSYRLRSGLRSDSPGVAAIFERPP